MSVFEQIANSTPINKTAYDVTSERGYHFAFDPKRLNNVRTDVPPLIISGQLKNEEELTGLVKGRLIVVGRSLDAWVNSQKIRWVVRCACGFYERMRTGVVKNLVPEEQMCSSCKLLEQRKMGYGPWMRSETSHQNAITQAIVPPAASERFCQVLPLTKQRLPKTPIPPEIRWAVWERDNFTCQHCGSRKHLAVDHILAESKGGMMVLSNLQTLCGRCNSKKGAR